MDQAAPLDQRAQAARTDAETWHDLRAGTAVLSAKSPRRRSYQAELFLSESAADMQRRGDPGNSTGTRKNKVTGT